MSMAEAFQFELVSPERLLVSEKVEFVVIPGTEGEMTVMANHAPVMSTVKPGVVTVKPVSGAEQKFVVFGGPIRRQLRPHPVLLVGGGGCGSPDLRLTSGLDDFLCDPVELLACPRRRGQDHHPVRELEHPVFAELAPHRDSRRRRP